MSVKHTIRRVEGGTVEVELSRASAIKAFCSECLGWETHPRDCTSTLCPLFPYRGRVMLAWDQKKRAATPASLEALAKARSNRKTQHETPQDRPGASPTSETTSAGSDANLKGSDSGFGGESS